ncbi:MAG TPA: VCBS repeat-containing protein [Bryobacteraceae bacterium]|nr:VCBS repeat-containing protein [Bryobacteraceae bacterium]
MSRSLVLLAIAPLWAFAQSTCPQVNFLTARTVNLKPSPTTHIDVVRQSDGSYTAYEVTDAAPYRTVNVTAHFERQFAACLPHTLPATPSTAPVAQNPPGAGSLMQVSTTLANGNTFVARISDDSLHYTVYFDVFDAQHNLLSETPFTPPSTSMTPPEGPTKTLSDTFESLALADLNGDGKLDLIAVFNVGPFFADINEGGAWTFLGNGDGTFQPGKRLVLSTVSPFVAPKPS